MAPDSGEDAAAAADTSLRRLARLWLIVTGSFAVWAASVDLMTLVLAGRTDAEAAVRVMAASCAWAVAAAGVATAALSAAGLAVRILWARGRLVRWLAPLIPAAPVCAALVLGLRSLLLGPKISTRSWIEEARLIATGLGVAGPWLAAVVIARLLARWHGPHASRGPGPGRCAAGLVLLAAGAAAATADGMVLPSLYPVAHLLAWMLVYLAVAAAAVVVTCAASRPLRPRWSAIPLIGLVVACPVVIGLDPLADHRRARAAAFSDTRFLKRALAHLAPRPAARAPSIDAELLASLRETPTLEAGVLDEILPGRRELNVLLLTIDTLRPDRLGINGYRRRLTPNIDRLIARSIHFPRAWSPYPETRFAFGSLFRGLYPPATDIFYKRSRELDSIPSERRQRTLPAIVRHHGWRTEAVTGFPEYNGDILKDELYPGFETVDVGRLGYRPAGDEITGRTLAALDRDPDRRFFLWAHYFDPHESVYLPIEQARLGLDMEDRYDVLVQRCDDAIGDLMDGLAARRLLDDTAIVLLSDHGEHFPTPRGRCLHGTTVRWDQVDVLLSFIVPGLAPRTVDLAVDLTDVMPTLLELLALEPPSKLHGQSLMRNLLTGTPAPDRSGLHPPSWAFSMIHMPWQPPGVPHCYAVTDGQHKLIWDEQAGVDYLYDVRADPRDEHDLAESHPEKLERMKAALDSFRALSEG